MGDPNGFLLPGMTRLGKEPSSDLKSYKSMIDIPSLVHRPLILLATATITIENIFSNGLFQNIYLFYRMFDAMGWTPVLLVNSKPKNLDGVPDILKQCRVIAVEDIVKQPLPIKVYIEIGMSIDPKTRKPRIASVVAGLSGPAIRPVALRMVWEVYQKIKIPIIGMGGIMDVSSALEFFLAGASAISIGTANFINPGITLEVLKGIETYLRENKITSIRDLTGSLKK